MRRPSRASTTNIWWRGGGGGGVKHLFALGFKRTCAFTIHVLNEYNLGYVRFEQLSVLGVQKTRLSGTALLNIHNICLVVYLFWIFS